MYADPELPWTIGGGDEHGGRSIHDQRIRSDVEFDGLRQTFKRQFGKRKAENPGEDEDTDPTPHSENLLLAEYLFSLVFLSMYREKGVPTMKIDAVKEVADQDAGDFTRKLGQVCNFNISGSLKKAIDVVKNVRFSQSWFANSYLRSTSVDGRHLCARSQPSCMRTHWFKRVSIPTVNVIFGLGGLQSTIFLLERFGQTLNWHLVGSTGLRSQISRSPPLSSNCSET